MGASNRSALYEPLEQSGLLLAANKGGTAVTLPSLEGRELFVNNKPRFENYSPDLMIARGIMEKLMTEKTNILSQLEQIQQNALAGLETVQDESGLQAWRTVHLGRSSPMMQVFSGLPQVSKELRPQV